MDFGRAILEKKQDKNQNPLALPGFAAISM
jgi:hypothetical protein